MKYVILEKIKSKLDFHPNGIEIGDRTIRGYMKKEPQIGQQLYLYDMFDRICSWTSKVISFDENQIETQNSKYIINYENYCEECYKTFFKNIVINEEHVCPKCFSNNIKKINL